jgi:signal peptidase II
MPKPDTRWHRWPIFLIGAPLVITADQLTKAWIRSYPVDSVILHRGILRIVHIENSGAAFGLFQSHSATLMVIDFIAIGIILAYFVFLHTRFALFRGIVGWIALTLVFAGASGNLIDRLNTSIGGITDFIYVSIWPAFNVADSAVTVGTILLAWSIVFSPQFQRKA